MTEADALELLAEIIREASDDTTGFTEVRTFGGNGHGLPGLRVTHPDGSRFFLVPDPSRLPR